LSASKPNSALGIQTVISVNHTEGSKKLMRLADGNILATDRPPTVEQEGISRSKAWGQRFSESLSPHFPAVHRRLPAWENDRRLKMKDSGVYSGKSSRNEISNFRNSPSKLPLNLMEWKWSGDHRTNSDEPG